MKRGRGNKALTAQDIADVQTLAANGYYIRCIAALFDVSETTIRNAIHGPRMEQELAIMPRRPHPLTWAQRVIWAAG